MGSSKAYWLIKNEVIYVHNFGDLIGDNFRAVDKEIIAFMNEAYSKKMGKVHVFVDSTEMGKLPPIMDLEGGRILTYLKEPNCGITVVVGYDKNPFLKILSRLLTTVMVADLYMAKSLKDGSKILEVSGVKDLPSIEKWKLSELS